MESITGCVEKITYINEENDFTIAKLGVENEREPVTILGTLYSISVGETLRVTGEWTNHASFGKQFKVIEFVTLSPETLTGMEKYLGSGLIKGIGPKTAKRIVTHFALSTLDIIEKSPEKLTEVDGIGEITARKIKTAWEEQREVRSIMLFLQSYGISSTYAIKIYKAYGKDSIKRVKENPYSLCDDIYGIGFKNADKIAFSLGIAKDSPVRAEAGILFMLNTLSSQGHCYSKSIDLVKLCFNELEIKAEYTNQAINTLLLGNKICVEDFNGEKLIYLKSLYNAEKNAGQKLITLNTITDLVIDFDFSALIKKFEKDMNITLSPEQFLAVEKALKEKVLVITGGPGTGKTTIINIIIKTFPLSRGRIALCAPTGRAAKRISETTGVEALTIHRLLEYNPKTGAFDRDEDNPLSAGIVIIDEASMVDIRLFHSVLKALNPGATLLLIGDVDQLPSVGPGNVLSDIINSNTVPVVRLKHIFRQGKESRIIINSHRINNGEFPIINNKEETDFYFIECNLPDELERIIVELCKTRIPSKFGFNPITDIQILCPMNKGKTGVHNLNAKLQEALNQNPEVLIRGSKTFKIGDKIIQLKNNYIKDVYNGDIGRIKNIDNVDQIVEIEFDSRVIPYDFSELDEITLSYAITIHKSQGSEFSAIIIPLTTEHYVMLQRNLVYTAVTRGKKLVNIVGTRKALELAIRNDKISQRNSLLAQRLQKLI